MSTATANNSVQEAVDAAILAAVPSGRCCITLYAPVILNLKNGYEHIDFNGLDITAKEVRRNYAMDAPGFQIARVAKVAMIELGEAS